MISIYDPKKFDHDVTQASIEIIKKYRLEKKGKER